MTSCRSIIPPTYPSDVDIQSAISCKASEDEDGKMGERQLLSETTYRSLVVKIDSLIYISLCKEHTII